MFTTVKGHNIFCSYTPIFIKNAYYDFMYMGERDIIKNKSLWSALKDKGYDLDSVGPQNNKIIIEFLKDFELGLNTPKKSKGARTPGTLLKLRNYCIFLNRQFPQKEFTKITKKELHSLFKGMSEGAIKKPNGYLYKDVGDVIKNTKTFVRWMVRTDRLSEDITEDLSAVSYKKQKPAWVYLKHKDIIKLNDSANAVYRPLMIFLYDSGLRPEEAFRIRVEDFKKDYSVLHIPKFREDGTKVSKTFERTIKLMTSSKLIKNYIELNNLKSNDLLIQKSPVAFNKYLKRLAVKIFGNIKTEARGYISKIRLYDIRHWSSIYWLDRYRTNKDLMYRMGWNKEDKVFYYSEFLGRRDKIDDEDMLTKEDKNKYEQEINILKKQETQNFELLRKLSSVTQVLLNSITGDVKTKERVKHQLIDILSAEGSISPLRLSFPSQ
jgi:integrase